MSPRIDTAALIPLLGRSAQMMGQRTIQVFGSVATSAAPATYNPEVTLTPGWSAYEGRASTGFTTRCERLWRISSAGVSVQRFTGDGEPPLPFGDFAPDRLPAGASFAPNGFYKIALDLGRATGQARYLIDVGQSFDVYAYSAELSLVGPTNSYEVTPNGPTPERAGIIVDARIGVDAVPVESPIGNREFKFTQHLSVPAGTRGVFVVPRSAISVTIYQSPAGAAAGDWTRFVGDPRLFAAFPTGVIAFVNQASLLEHRPLGDETHLQSDLDALVDRLFTAIWRIRP